MATFIMGKKEFKTERGLLGHVAKCFPNAEAELVGDDILLSIRGDVSGKLTLKKVHLTGKSVILVSELRLA